MFKSLLMIFLLLAAPSVFGQINKKGLVVCGKAVKYRQLKVANQKRFQYLIYDNIFVADAKESEGDRAISVFLPRQVMTDDNLKALFLYLSKRFPSPKGLHIYVETNSKKIPGPGKCERWGESGGPDTDTPEDYPFVRFYRLNGNEFFRVFYEKYASAKTIVLKGKDPFSN